jgi:hypothetical protein
MGKDKSCRTLLRKTERRHRGHGKPPAKFPYNAFCIENQPRSFSQHDVIHVVPVEWLITCRSFPQTLAVFMSPSIQVMPTANWILHNDLELAVGSIHMWCSYVQLFGLVSGYRHEFHHSMLLSGPQQSNDRYALGSTVPQSSRNRSSWPLIAEAK